MLERSRVAKSLGAGHGMAQDEAVTVGVATLIELPMVDEPALGSDENTRSSTRR